MFQHLKQYTPLAVFWTLTVICAYLHDIQDRGALALCFMFMGIGFFAAGVVSTIRAWVQDHKEKNPNPRRY